MEAAGLPAPELPLPRMTYREAMDRYGSDKPDLRFGMEITDLAEVFAGTQFKVFARALESGGVVKAINAKGLFQAPIKMVEEDWTGLAKEGGLGGLAYIRVQEDGTWKSPIVKFFSDAEKAGLQAALGIEPGDLVLFGADRAEKVLPVLGRIRLLAAAQAKAIPEDVFRFTWVTDFPQDDLEYSIEVIRSNFGLKGFGNISSYMFGDRIAETMGYPRVGLSDFAGYAVGYNLVSRFLKKNRMSVLEATCRSAEEILSINISS